MFIRHVKRRWEQFIENTLSLILEQISLKFNLCATVICNVLLIRQQEKVILFMWINRMLLYLFAQVFSLSLSLDQRNALSYIDTDVTHCHNMQTIPVMWEECPWWVVCVLLMVYVVVCYNGKGRCNIQGLPKSPECTHYLHLLSHSLQRTDVCYLPCHFIRYLCRNFSF